MATDLNGVALTCNGKKWAYEIHSTEEKRKT